MKSDKPVTKYFVNRVEIGHALQTQDRLELYHKFFQNPESEEARDDLHNATLNGMTTLSPDAYAFDVKVQCNIVDQLGNQSEQGFANIEHSVSTCAYVKLLNVPSMLDIGGMTPDPTDEMLTLSMIDHATLSVISEFSSRQKLGAEMLLKEPSLPYTCASSDEEEDPDPEEFTNGTEPT